MHVCVELKNDIKRDVGFELSATDITAQGEKYCAMKLLKKSVIWSLRWQ